MFTPKTTAHADEGEQSTDLYWGFDDGVLTLSSDGTNPATPYEYGTYKDGNLYPNWMHSDHNNANVNSNDIVSVTVDGYAYAPQSMASWFQYCNYLTTVDLRGLDTSSVTDMSGMFQGCGRLTSVNLSSLDTSNVTTMSYMFYSCRNLTELDISDLDTSSVTDMGGMFYYCFALKELNLSDINTAKVENMQTMFYFCEALTELDLSSFNTASLTNANNIFSNCNSLNVIHTPKTVGSVALPLPCNFWDSDADSDADDNVKFIGSITSANENHTIYRHEWGHTGGTATCTTKAVCDICGENYGDLAEHDFADEWTYDETSHWHECQNGCGKFIHAYSHSYPEEVVSDIHLKSAATCNAKAVYFKSCECGAHGTETFEYGELIPHTLAEAVRENEVAATCTQAGSYDEVVYCSICGEELSRTQKPIDVNSDAHNYGEWTVVKQATEAEEGEERRICANDETHYETRTLPELTPTTPTEKENKSYWWLFWLLIPLAIGVGGVTLGIWIYKNDKKNNRL